MTKTRLADVPLPAAEEAFLTRLEACRVARIGLTTFDRAVAAGRIKIRRTGRKILVPRQELERFIEDYASHA